MQYILVDTKRWTQVSGRTKSYFDTLKGANRACAALMKREMLRAEKYNYPMPSIVPMTPETFHAGDDEVEVTSMMNGAKVKIRRSDVGSCCDPSTERYWTM